jgi:hypothetical protein
MMRVPCIKGHTLAERDFGPKVTVMRQWVKLYNDICDSCDICKDNTCVFYDDTVEGTRKFIEGSNDAHSSIERVLKEKEDEKYFLKFYGYTD